jgi:glycosyltransferase involved in cell wall biosynthesis
MKVSVVIPCYNEAENIPLIFEKFKSVIKDEEIEVLLVNNGSSDHSAEIIERLLPENPYARCVVVPVNKGYGYGILQGLHEAQGDFVGWTHADLQTDPADIIKAYHVLEENQWSDRLYVKGSRLGRSLGERFFTFGMGIFETLYLGRKLFDINAQPNIFSKKFYAEWKNPPYDFSLDLYALYMAGVKGLNVKRIPVIFPPRIHGASHWNTGLASKWKFIKRTLDFSKKLKHAGIV